MGIIKPFTERDAQKNLQDAYNERLQECADAGVYRRVTPTGLIVVEYGATKKKEEDFKEGDLLIVRRVDLILEGRVYNRGTFRDSPKMKYKNWMGKVVEKKGIRRDFFWTEKKNTEYPECTLQFTDKTTQTFFHCELSLADKKERFLYEMSGSDILMKEKDDD